MMISRIARIQVLSFLVAAMVGVVYVALNYLGVADRLLGKDYVVHVELATAGSIQGALKIDSGRTWTIRSIARPTWRSRSFTRNSTGSKA